MFSVIHRPPFELSDPERRALLLRLARIGGAALLAGSSTRAAALGGQTLSIGLDAVRALESGLPERPEWAPLLVNDVQEAQLPQTNADVVVIGGGAAGLSAAVTAAQTLAASGTKKPRVVLLEKNAHLGGDTLISGGYFNAVDPARQQPQGIHDSVELFASQILREGEGCNDPEVVRTLAEQATDALAWLEAQGMTFLPTVTEVYGSVHPRAHKPILPRGRSYVRALTESAVRSGATIRTRQRALGFVLDARRRFAGVLYEDRSAGSRGPHSPRVIWAQSGIVIASGGFGASRELLSTWAPAMTDLPVDTQPGSTGDLHRAAEAAGAALVDMPFVECVPGSRRGINYPIRLDYHPDRMIFVNGAGERFVLENGTRSEIAAAILETRQPVWTVADNACVRHFDMNEQKAIHRGYHAGEVRRAGTPAELARAMEIPVEAFLQTVAEEPARSRLVEPPFWACRTQLRVHATLGGIRIDAKARVLSPEGTPLVGLWAAGSCTGGVHGKSRIGGNGINTAVVFGRLAGKGAAGAADNA